MKRACSFIFFAAQLLIKPNGFSQGTLQLHNIRNLQPTSAGLPPHKLKLPTVRYLINDKWTIVEDSFLSNEYKIEDHLNDFLDEHVALRSTTRRTEVTRNNIFRINNGSDVIGIRPYSNQTAVLRTAS